MQYFLAFFSRKWLVLVALLSIGSRLVGQEFSYSQFDVKDGLAGSVVYCAAQDKEHFLWFGTETGLSRFDGTHFYNFTTTDGLPDNEIINLFVDSKNRVWIIPFKNSICYYLKGKIHTRENDSLLNRIPFSNEVRGITEDQAGNVLILLMDAIFIISPQMKVWAIPSSGPGSPKFSLVGPNNSGGFRVVGCTASNLCYFYLIHNDTISFEENAILLRQGMQSGLISPHFQVYRYNDSFQILYPDEKNEFSLPVPRDLIDLSAVNDSLLAINKVNGSLVYNLKTRSIFNYFLNSNKVNTVIQDSENNYWLCTGGNGIFRIGSTEFKNLGFVGNNQNYSVYSIAKSSSGIYVGTDNFLLWTVDSASLKLRMHKLSNKFTGRITALCNAGNTTIIGTDQGFIGLDMVKKKKDSIEIAVPRPGTKNNFYSKNFTPYISVKTLKNYNDTILVGTNISVLTVDASDFSHWKSIWDGRSTCACKQGNLYYIGTLNGLYVVDSSRRITFLGDQVPVFKGRIAAIDESNDGSLWIATGGHGIVIYRNGQATTLTKNDGLTNDICRNIFIQENDTWVGTDRGLNRVHKENDHYTITNFTTADGLESDVINAIYISGSMAYIGTPKGITLFDINKISTHSICDLHITRINTPANSWLYDTSGLILPHAENSVEFDFVAVSYRSGGDILYRYRLLGLDTAWHTTRQTSLNYPAIPSGEYQLQIEAVNKFGVHSNMATVAFAIEKLLWERTWFRIVALIIISLCIWIFVNIRIRRIRKQEKAQQRVSNRINELEQMALKAQMNPHFIFNSLNSIQTYVVDRNIEGANKFITEFARLIRLTLDLSSKSEINVEEELNYISTYLELEKAKLEEKFNYFVTVAQEVNKEDWFLPPMILQPYIENAIRHGIQHRKDNKGLITVKFDRNENYLLCVICDNGIGRQRSQQMKESMNLPLIYQSKGMMLTTTRVEMINSNRAVPILIDIEDNNPGDKEYKGTKVMINFPIRDIGQSN